MCVVSENECTLLMLMLDFANFGSAYLPKPKLVSRSRNTLIHLYDTYGSLYVVNKQETTLHRKNCYEVSKCEPSPVTPHTEFKLKNSQVGEGRNSTTFECGVKLEEFLNLGWL